MEIRIKFEYKKICDMNTTLISIIIRTLNEERHLPSLLKGIYSQKCIYSFDINLIDSGSDDQTLKIAKDFKCRITHIDKKDFSFGRSLNQCINFSKGCYLVLISGHCIPKNNYWLENLVKPLVEGSVQLTYGRQLAGEKSNWSERQIYKKYFPVQQKIPQEGFFCNNANSAVLRSTWEKYKFNEELTGLEDMEFAKRMVNEGGKVGYVSTSEVYHLHNESWSQVRRRFEREAIALKVIFPEIQIKKRNVINYILAGIWNDIFPKDDVKPKLSNLMEIIFYRINQYFGSYKGNNYRNSLTEELREVYFYPKPSINDISKIRN